jgi:hypothetical protein
LRNDVTGWESGQYLLGTFEEGFDAEMNCRLVLYYSMPAASANQYLRFVFDYTTANGKRIRLDAPVDVFP